MKRREFIAGLGAAAWPIVARAQQGERVRRLGVLFLFAESDERSVTYQKVIRDELARLGWIEGRNLRLDFRYGGGDINRMHTYAAELVKLAPDVIFAQSGAALFFLQQATTTIPIVIAGGGDFVAQGIVKNVARPEGNITGFTANFNTLGSKWLELLKEAAPNLARAAFLPLTLSKSLELSIRNNPYLPSMAASAQSMVLRLVTLPVSDAASASAAIEGFVAEPNGGVIPGPGLPVKVMTEVIRLAQKYRFPAIYANPFYPAAGGLMSYGPSDNPLDLVLGAARYVDRILRGAKVTELPVQFPTRFKLVINLKTAKALGLEMPPSILLRADEVIQ
jgi:putative ABC transport system substrate-binding protein